MAKQKTRKGKAAPEKPNELLENPDAIATRLGRGELFLKENTKIVAGAIGVVIAVIAGILFFQIHKANQNKKAQGEMFQAVYYFEQDSVEFALEGDGVQPGFLEIIDNYGGTDAANIAHFYVGSIYLSQGEFQSAIDHLDEFSSSDYFIQGHAYSLTGDAYLELGDMDEAINYYKKAADYNRNEYFTPKYLMKLALAYEEAGDLENAIETYEEIESEYFDAYEYTEARKQKARLEGLASN
ncbi:MAG: tetratricopeptide repeat protein [Cyclobacteriaceae bacterium]